MTSRLKRRAFLRTLAIGSSTMVILPRARLAFAYEVNDKLKVAGIGVGGQGRADIDVISSLGVEVVALCDVDIKRAGDIFQKHPQAKAFTDFRQMLDQMDQQVEAVVVAT